MNIGKGRNIRRICVLQPDYLLSIVEKPNNWTPESLLATPPVLKTLRSFPVASYSEALDDVLRCNRYSLELNLRYWAIVQSTEAGL